MARRGFKAPPPAPPALIEDPLAPKTSCPSSKRRFATEEDALRAAREGMLFKGAPPLTAYACLLCMGHHLTSRAREPKARKRRK